MGQHRTTLQNERCSWVRPTNVYSWPSQLIHPCAQRHDSIGFLRISRRLRVHPRLCCGSSTYAPSSELGTVTFIRHVVVRALPKPLMCAASPDQDHHGQCEQWREGLGRRCTLVRCCSVCCVYFQQSPWPNSFTLKLLTNTNCWRCRGRLVLDRCKKGAHSKMPLRH